MLNGDLHLAFDAELTAMRGRAKDLCFKLNQTNDKSEREIIIKALLSSTSAHLESPFNCDYGIHISVGADFYANHGCTILDGAKVTIGDNCLLAPHVVISTVNHPLDVDLRVKGYEIAKPITIGHNVWLGANVTVLGGVNIGDNVVVGAGSVVTKNLPNNTVCLGSPAKPVKEI
ncbi:sugar O-acetyltransferase [Moritella sp. 24]|nr:sugar O-acetyltransferase [Moritella sp. 24]